MCKLFAQNYESYIRRFFSAEITSYTVINSGIPDSSMLVSSITALGPDLLQMTSN